MASLREDKRTGRFYVMFRFRGRQYQRVLPVGKRRAALATVSRVEETISLIELGRVAIPDDVDPAAFILSDGRIAAAKPIPAHVRLRELTDQYAAKTPSGSKEDNTLQCEQIHIAHLHRLLGKGKFVGTITLSCLQDYVSSRTQEHYRGRAISAETVRKEIATLRLIWNWGNRNGLLAGECPTRGLQYPKSDEKPPFMTWEEIEHRIDRGGLTEAEEGELWDCLFLTTDQIEELLADVRGRSLCTVCLPDVSLRCPHGSQTQRSHPVSHRGL